MILAAGDGDAALAFVEIGALALGLALLSRIAGRLGITAVPLYLLAGLAFGDGGIAQIDVSLEFASLAAEIGVLLLLFTLGLEYSDVELRNGLRTGLPPGLTDMVLNASPGLIVGLVLGWDLLPSILLGGVTWISSSGIVAKSLRDLGRLGFRETPSVLNLLVIEDLAMAIYLPVVAALIIGGTVTETVTSVVVALATVAVILALALRFGGLLSRWILSESDEALLLAVFGLTLLVAGVAQSFDVSGAVGAFLVGLALSGPAEERALKLMSPLRDVFAGTFFLFFTFAIDPADLPDAAIPAIILATIGIASKIGTGWYAAARLGVGRRGRLRAGTMLVARGEFSIVIAALGADLVDGDELGAVAASFVLITAVAGPILTKVADRIPLSGRLRTAGRPAAEEIPGAA